MKKSVLHNVTQCYIAVEDIECNFIGSPVVYDARSADAGEPMRTKPSCLQSSKTNPIKANEIDRGALRMRVSTKKRCAPLRNKANRRTAASDPTGDLPFRTEYNPKAHNVPDS